MNFVFANRCEEETIYPLTTKEIAQAQKKDSAIKKLTELEKYEFRLVENTQVLCKDGKLVIPQNFSIAR